MFFRLIAFFSIVDMVDNVAVPAVPSQALRSHPCSLLPGAIGAPDQRPGDNVTDPQGQGFLPERVELGGMIVFFHGKMAFAGPEILAERKDRAPGPLDVVQDRADLIKVLSQP